MSSSKLTTPWPTAAGDDLPRARRGLGGEDDDEPDQLADDMQSLIDRECRLAPHLQLIDDGVGQPFGKAEPDSLRADEDEENSCNTGALDASVGNEVIEAQRPVEFCIGKEIALQRVIEDPVNADKHQRHHHQRFHQSPMSECEKPAGRSHPDDGLGGYGDELPTMTL